MLATPAARKPRGFSAGGTEFPLASEIGLAAQVANYSDRRYVSSLRLRAKTRLPAGSLHRAGDSRSGGEDVLHAQRLAALDQPDQAVDVGVLARVEARILAVLGVDLDALGGGLGVIAPWSWPRWL
jgi:hypothetical protein